MGASASVCRVKICILEKKAGAKDCTQSHLCHRSPLRKTSVYWDAVISLPSLARSGPLSQTFPVGLLDPAIEQQMNTCTYLVLLLNLC